MFTTTSMKMLACFGSFTWLSILFIFIKTERTTESNRISIFFLIITTYNNFFIIYKIFTIFQFIDFF
eukprot:UN01436